MNYAQIKPCSIENGTGVRVSLFVSGCRHHCKECFNEETWDFSYGKPFTKTTEDQQGLLPLLQRIKKELPDKNIWAYSGYLYEDFLPGGKVYCEASEPFLSMIDVMVDGPFILEKKDISLNFRGSSNQRIIDVAETRKNQEIVLLME